ncbi:uncharacterized protein LOC129580954 [Paramacrobiotus metropolitanus]|uniref:uncharacterized protein LOC129580954 n=1 Tax=Paramacrobiotus metropolitanus TaxID=2943436 RepID=UPI00244600B6|nr:uncharacterized protein LOC129580954 [Paramacrobiotus metropolitanus]
MQINTMQSVSAAVSRMQEVLKTRRCCAGVPPGRLWLLFSVNIFAIFIWWFAILEMDVEVSDTRYWRRPPSSTNYTSTYGSVFRKGQASMKTYSLLYRVSILFHLSSTFTACIVFLLFRVIVLRNPQRLCMYCEVAKVGFSAEDVNNFQKKIQLLCIIACIIDIVGWIFDMHLLYGLLSPGVTATLKKAQIAYHISNAAALMCHIYGAMATVRLPKAFFEELKPALKTYCFHCLYPVKLTVD